MSSLSQLRLRAANQLRTVIPLNRRRQVAWARLRLRGPTARFRALPDVLIIGAQRAGTSSLYRYLGAHPDAVPSLRKETEYFSKYYGRGKDWYRAHFPLGVRGSTHRFVHRRQLISLEATPDYLLDPRAAARAAQLIPNAKIVALLRDPVARAFSHYQHMTRLGFETLSFEAAIAEEGPRIGEARSRIRSDELFASSEFLRFSYLERGRYADQLQTWLDHFERQNVLVVKSENLYADPADAFSNILEFIGLSPSSPTTFANHSYATKDGRPDQPNMDSSTRSDLEKHFAPLNSDLYALLGRDLDWGQLARDAL